MKNANSALWFAVAALLPLWSGSLARAATFNVKQCGAVGDGIHDDTAAVQSAVDQASKAGSGNTVLLPAGTYLLADGPIRIHDAANLTFTGAGVDKTMLWYTFKHPRPINVRTCKNLTIQNFSLDVQKLPDTGKYDLGETQGTITAVDRTARTVTVRVEDGYPLMTRADIQSVPQVGWHTAWLWLRSDPTRLDVDDPGGYSPAMKSIASSADGTTATLTLDYVPQRTYVGEQWIIYTQLDSICFDICYDSGTTTLQNIHYYGGAVNWMGAANYNSGALIFKHLYCGPPPYQSGRVITCNEGWAMSLSSRNSMTVSDCVFQGTWDDIFDRGCDSAKALSQPAANQVVVSDGNGSDYQVGDTVEFYNVTDPPKGAVYGKSAITAIMRQADQTWRFTLDQPVTVKHLSKDYLTDLSQAGPLTATRCTFSCGSGRNVYFRSSRSVTARDCVFKDNTPLVIGGFEDGEGPGEASNVTVTGCTFLHSQGLTVAQNGGSDAAVTGSNVTVSHNRFINCGRYGSMDSHPLMIGNVSGVTVSDNWFENNWGVNAQFKNDAKVTVAHNTFAYPNQIQGSDPEDTSVIHLANVIGGSLSGNLVYGAGAYTDFLDGIGENVTGVMGLANGTLDIDNPLALYAADGKRARVTPTSGAVSKQADWTVLPVAAAPGCFSLHNASPSAQLWAFESISDSSLSLVNRRSKLTRRVQIVMPPKASVTQQLGTVTIGWAPVPYATSYSVGRSMNPGGPYTTLASGLAAGPYLDTTVSAGTPYFYVVTAAGLPVSNAQANEVCAVPNADYVPVNLAPACNLTRPEPAGRYIHWNRALFILGAPGQPNAASEAGQRIILPSGQYSRLLIFGSTVDGANTAFQPAITYTDGSSAVLGQGATLDAVSQPHGISFRLDPNKGVAWLTLPKTGAFEVLAMDLSGATAARQKP